MQNVNLYPLSILNVSVVYFWQCCLFYLKNFLIVFFIDSILVPSVLIGILAVQLTAPPNINGIVSSGQKKKLANPATTNAPPPYDNFSPIL